MPKHNLCFLVFMSPLGRAPGGLASPIVNPKIIINLIQCLTNHVHAMARIIEVLKMFGKWIKHWLWDVPTAKLPKEEPAKVKATEVAKEWMVVQYHGQRIPLHINEYPIWKSLSRYDKRAMAKKCEQQEKSGLIRFEEVEGKMICVRNLDYQKRVEKAKQEK